VKLVVRSRVCNRSRLRARYPAVLGQGQSCFSSELIDLSILVLSNSISLISLALVHGRSNSLLIRRNLVLLLQDMLVTRLSSSEDGATHTLIYIDSVVFQAPDGSGVWTSLPSATRNDPLKDQEPPAEPRIMGTPGARFKLLEFI
jgi:hypothetical protein